MTKVAAFTIGAMIVLCAIESSVAGHVASEVAPPCGSRIKAEILAQARHSDDAVQLSCSLTLQPTDIVTKRLLLEGPQASGVTVDCRGATIGRFDVQPSHPNATLEIRSASVTDQGRTTWSRPSDIAIRNCTIAGPIRIWGMGVNGQATVLRLSSRALGHTERAQAAAPTRILIEDVKLVGSGPIPLYVAPGVSEVTLRRSHIAGHAVATAVYLDAESARNALVGNTFDIRTGREVVAVDGSAYNSIYKNRFQMRYQGGVYLYRNCGEGGTIRHQTPSHNIIRDNVFSYTFPLHSSAIKVGARSGWGLYCHEDAGYPFGSSIDDGDGATDNTVEGNRID